MGGDTEPKKQLGKIMLQRKLVTPDELADMLEEQKRSPGARLASTAAATGRISVAAALDALSEQHGVPPIDLTTVIVPLTTLQLIPREIADEREVFPFAGNEEVLYVAMANPSDGETMEEIGFLAAKTVVPHVALESDIQQVIEQAYGMLGEGRTHYIGASVGDEAITGAGLDPEHRADDLELPPELAQNAPSDAPPLDPAFSEKSRPSMPPTFTADYADKRVLLVDAESAGRTTLRGKLEGAGIPVAEASDGVEALEFVREDKPTMLVLEASLAKVHGFDICQRLKGSPRFGDIPVVLISERYRGWRTQEDLKDTFGIDCFFEKPINVDRLLTVVRCLLEGKEVPEEADGMTPDAEGFWDRAMKAFDEGDLDAAIGALEEGVVACSSCFDLHYHLGLLYGRRGNLFSSIESLEDAVALQTKHFSALKNLAVVYQRAGFRRRAADVWQRAMAAAPDDETRDGIRDLVLELL